MKDQWEPQEWLARNRFNPLAVIRLLAPSLLLALPWFGIRAEGLASLTWEPSIHGIISRQYHAGAFIPGLSFAFPELVDTNGDGDLDMAVGGADGLVYWYQNIGRPTNPLWDYPQTNALPRATSSLAAPDFHDLDGDGDMDLILGGGDGQIHFIENLGGQGAAIWATPIPLQAGLSASLNARPEIHDIDHNGLPDLFFFDVHAAGSGGHQLRIRHYEDTDPGPAWNFVLKVPNFTGITVSHPAAYPLFEGVPVVPVPRITFTDLNGDGLPDFLLGRIDGFFDLYRNVGTANAPSFTRVARPYNQFSVLADATPCVGDLNGDGKIDILSGAFDGAITFFLNTGTAQAPNHNQETSTFFNHDNGGPTAPMALDLDADGDTDLVVGHHFGVLLHLFNTGSPVSPRWERKRAVHLTQLVSWYRDYAAFANTISLQKAKPAPVDYDGDGDTDYLVSERNGTLHLLENVGNPVVPIHVTATLNVFSNLVYAEEIRPACGDVNGDGLVDVLVGREDGSLDFWPNVGSATDGQWLSPQTNFAGVAVGALAAPWIADLDGDGDPDILVGAADGRLSVLENTGTAQSPIWGILHTDYGGIDVGERSVPCVMDWDGDGDPDIVCGEKQGGLLVWLNTRPKLNVIPQSVTRVGTDPLSFAVAEKDAAGLQWDLVRNRSGSIINATNGVYVPGEGTTGFYQYREYADVDIPDGNPAGYAASMVLNGYQTISNLQATIEINHPDISQIKVVLRSPSGTQVTLYDGGNSGAHLYRVVSDDGPHPPVQGQLADFIGESASGQWWFDIIDAVPGITGDVFNIGLRINGGIGLLDSVRVVAADGREGRAYVNVIESSAASHAGKAIIVAGGKGLDDPVWTATRYMAEKAYQVLRLRGYNRDNIRFLSLEPSVDVDGNGIAGDDAVPCTRAELLDAFGNFTQNAESLTLFLLDHGATGDQGTYFRLNATEVVSPVELAQWVGQVQSNQAIDVMASLDFCYAATFLGPMAAHSAARQIIMASCATNELSYFIGGGQVSFTSLFLNNVLQGQDVGQAFNQARDAMAPYQSAQLDDNRSGTYTSADGGRAAAFALGMRTTPGRNLPEIWLFTPNQVLTNSAPVHLYCSRSGSAQEIQSARAIITPPNHQPDPASGDPVIDLPVLNLVWNPLTAYFEGYYEGFTQAGTYAVTFILEDIYGSVSYPKTTTLVQDGLRQRVLLANGGPPSDTVQQGMADFAYSVYRSRLFQPSQILYWDARGNADADGDSTNDVSGLPTLANLAHAFTNDLALAETLVVHLLGPSTNDTLLLDGQTLPADLLAQWLDLVASTNVPVTVILDFEGSQTYLPVLAKPGRILLASGPSGRPNLRDASLGFTPLLMGAILEGLDVSDAMTRTRKTLLRVSGNLRQRALIDDSGDGIPNQKNIDGMRSHGLFLGSPFVTGEDRPFIGSTMPPVRTPLPAPTLLWVDGVQDADGIQSVTVTILPPEGEPTTLDLVPVPSSARHEVLWNGWSVPGLYTLVFEATDSLGQRSQPALSTLWLSDASGPGGLDGYEPDNTFKEARLLSLPRSELHTLHVAEDQDWIRFHADSNLVIDVETEHLDHHLDTVIELYRETGPGVLSLVSRTDEFGYGEGELSGLTFPESGLYALRVRHDMAQAHAPGEYLLHLYVPAGVQGLWVVVRNLLTLAPITDHPVHLLDPLGAPIQSQSTDSQGRANFQVASGDYRVATAPPNGFLPVYGYVDPADNPDNPSSTYGNPRALGGEDFGSLVFGQSPNPVSVMGFYFFPVITLTGQVDIAEVEWPTQVRVLATDLAVTNLYERYPWTLYGDLWWLRPDGTFPERLHLPAGIPLRIEFGGNGYQGDNVALAGQNPGAILSPGIPLPSPTDSNTNNIPDAWEHFHFQALVAGGDDGDADDESNEREYIAGTDPTDPEDQLRLPDFDWVNGLPHLRWIPRSKRTYAIEQIQLIGTQRVDVAEFVVGAHAPSLLSWPMPGTGTGGVYRLRVDVPPTP